MAFSITERLELLKDATNKEPQIIIRIENIPIVFGAQEVQTVAKFDMEGIFFDDDDLFFDDVVIEPNSVDYISMDGTTNNINQQLLQDQGGASSVTQFKVKIVNKNREVSDLFVPGVNTDDILGSNAEVFFTFQGASFPEDAIPVTRGIIAGFDYGVGSISLSISHPDELKRQKMYTLISTELDGGIDDTVTSLDVLDSTGLLATQDNSTLHIKIGDEIMEVTNIATNTLTVVRASLSTIASAHSDEDEATSYYRLQDTPIILALKIMLSGGAADFATRSPLAFVKNEGQVIPNAVIFNSIDIQDELGLTIGDTLTTTGAANGDNNVVNALIIGFGQLPASSFIICSGVSFVEELDTAAICGFQSQYNVLSDGLAMKPIHVDVAGHNSIDALYGSAFPVYDFLLDDTIEGTEFISKELYFPIGLYSLPRKGRSSLGYTSPPLNLEQSPVLDENNIKNLDKLKINRSITRDFYNAVVIKYNPDPLTGELLQGSIFLSTESTDRIPIKNRPLTIEARGLRKGNITTNALNRFATKALERYKFGAQKIAGVEMLLETGFALEAGDVLTFGGAGTQLIDPETGELLTRRLMEVVNRSVNMKTGNVKVDLLNTAFDIDGRFGIIGPSSIIDASATTTEIPLKKSFGTGEFTNETSKWAELIDLSILIHDEDYNSTQTTTIVDISSTKPDTLIVSPALSVPPSEDDIIDLINYDETDIESQDIAKATYTYIGASPDVDSGTSNFIFDVVDASDMFIGSQISVHSDDFTNESPQTTILDITGTTITVEDDLGFTPSSGEIVELIGFGDGGNAYRFI